MDKSPAVKKNRKHLPKLSRISDRSQKIIAAKTANPNLTSRQIGAMVKCSHSNVIQTLNRYSINNNEVQDYKDHRADIMAGLQGRLLRSLTKDDIKSATLLQRVTGYGILYDKERLERGLSSSNVSIQVGLSNTLQASIDALVRRVPDVVDVGECAIVAQRETDNEVPLSD